MATWPTAVATDANLYLAVNELQTNLTSAITNSQTTITLNSTSSFPTVGLVLIDNEIIKYTGISGSDLTGCTRAFDGTSAATHSGGAVVSFAICAAHHNSLKDEIKAIETTLSGLVGLSATLPLTVSLPVQTDSNGHLTASAITLSSSGVTGTLPIAKGGTNSSTALVGHKAIVSDASKLVESTTTDTEIGFVSGVTSAIQTQLGTKAPAASPTFTGTIGTPLTASKAVQTDVSGNLTTSTETGTGSIVRATSPTLVTPTLGAATATSITFSPATGGIVGTTTNDNAGIGVVGEYVEAIIASGSAVALTSPNAKSITSISLTAGDWDVFGMTGFTFTSASMSLYLTGNSVVNNTIGAESFTEVSQITQSQDFRTSWPLTRLSLSSTTTVYLVAQATFSGTAVKAFGRISARRVR